LEYIGTDFGRRQESVMIKYTCDWCGKTIEVEEPGLPEGWKTLEYDTNKYTDVVDPAEVCSQECEIRLVEKFATGGGR
jgi:hypothetical protein